MEYFPIIPLTSEEVRWEAQDLVDVLNDARVMAQRIELFIRTLPKEVVTPAKA